jgi:hypothetical protein
MDKKINAILIDEKDNVITATESLQAGSVATYQRARERKKIILTEAIPKFHKIALIDIKEKQPVFKYGQLIGETTRTISKGSHVHDHNITSPKKNL